MCWVYFRSWLDCKVDRVLLVGQPEGSELGMGVPWPDDSDPVAAEPVGGAPEVFRSLGAAAAPEVARAAQQFQRVVQKQLILCLFGA